MAAELSRQHAEDDVTVAATLAHEFNNPLGALLNIFYLIESQGTLTPEGQYYLNIAKKEIDHLAQIAKSALNDACGREVRAKADVSALLHSVVDFYSPTLHARGIGVQAHYLDGSDLSIHSPSVRQAFSNLLLNAAEAIPERGRIDVRISSTREFQFPFRKGLRITFRDSGSGIAPEHIGKIFDPFFTTKGTNGTGLGLASVHKTVEQHGGKIRVRTSRRNGRTGSVFSMFLPYEASTKN